MAQLEYRLFFIELLSVVQMILHIIATTRPSVALLYTSTHFDIMLNLVWPSHVHVSIANYKI